MAKRASLNHRASSIAFSLRGELLEDRRLLAFDPSGFEQAYMESLNRMRADPQGELEILFSSLDPLVARESSVQAAIDFFGVSGNLLQSQWSQLTAVGPLAWNEDLYDAAEKHNFAMQSADLQSHQVPGEAGLGDRVEAEGYSFNRLNENVFAFAESHIQGHAGFVIDWGNGPGGIQDPAGHRDAIMDGRLTDVGIHVLADTNPSNSVGPNLVTQDFGRPQNAGQPFLLGVAWNDGNSNGIYDPGEGLADASITVSGPAGTFTTTTMTAGGYQVRVPRGTYQMTIQGGAFGAAQVVSNVVVGAGHEKVDFVPGQGATPPIANADSFVTSENGLITQNVLANDRYENGQTVAGQVVIASGPTSGTITNIGNNGAVTYRPNAGFFGTDSFRYFVTDNQGIDSNTTTVTISVSDVNDAPVAQSLEAVTQQGQSLVILLDAFASDFDGTVDWSSLELTTPTSGTAAIFNSDGAVRYVPAAGFAGQASFDYRVADEDGSFSNYATIEVTIEDVNDVPMAVDDVFATTSGTSIALPVLNNDTDLDGDLQSAEIQLGLFPISGQIAIAGRNVQYIPTEGFVGYEEFTYRVVDTQGAVSNEATVRIYSTDPANRWRNPIDAADVNGDTILAAVDVVQVINRIGTALGDSNLASPPFLDPNGNGVVDPGDAILVVNRLIAQSQGVLLNAPAAIGISSATSEFGAREGFESRLDEVEASPEESPIALEPIRVDEVYAVEDLHNRSFRSSRSGENSRLIDLVLQLGDD